MTGYALYHDDKLKADSLSLDWIKSDAMIFHGSAYAAKVFILPHAA